MGNILALEELGGQVEGLRKKVSRGRRSRKEWKTERCSWTVKSIMNQKKDKGEDGKRHEQPFRRLVEAEGSCRGCSERGWRGRPQCAWLSPEWYFPKCGTCSPVVFQMVLGGSQINLVCLFHCATCLDGTKARHLSLVKAVGSEATLS